MSNNHEDRLSSLPDAILITILSLIPIDTAVSTSVLSHRWRHLWTHRTTLPIKTLFQRFNFQKFSNIVNQILRQLKSPKLDSFSIVFDSHNVGDGITTFLQCLIPLVNARNPDQIMISQYPLDRFCKSINLPSELFHNRLLSRLELCGPIEYRYSDLTQNGIHLPELKLLKLTICDIHLPLMNVILNSCQKLESFDLVIYPMALGYDINISSSSLRSLCVDYSYYYDEDLPDQNWIITINTPKLERIMIWGELTGYRFVNFPTTLLSARFDLSCVDIDDLERRGDLDEIDCYIGTIMRIFRGVSGTESLYLSSDTLSLLDQLWYLAKDEVDDEDDEDDEDKEDNIEWPVFRNLIHLFITEIWRNNELAWKWVLPASLLSNVKTIEILDTVTDFGIIELIEYILSNALVLEKLIVSISKHDKREGEDQLEEHEFCEDLFMLSKGYLVREIEFYGLCFKKTSNEFKKGPVVYRINDYEYLQ